MNKRRSRQPPVREESAPIFMPIDALGEPFLETPLDVAEGLVEKAMGCRNKTQREALAWQALKVYPDCVDACMLLSMDAPGLREARSLVEQAVAAAERILGPRVFQKEAGNFWRLFETRPYMQARELLASCSWDLGERQAACAHYQDLLRLNPNDNQGIRYVLSSCLLEMNEHEALARLLATYARDGSAHWAYASALLAFRQKGPTAATARKLDKALERNRFVPPYLLGHRSLPDESPEFVQQGGESEAMEYVRLNETAWAQTPGALEWLGQASDGRGLPSADVAQEVEESSDVSPVP